MKLTISQKTDKQNFFFYSFAIAIFFIGLWLRIEYLNRHLEYDEIWTLTHYAGQPISLIFADLATPNNHPLSTLLIKFFTDLFGIGFIIQRLPALLSGIILLFIITHLSFIITKSRFCALLTLAFASFNGGLIYYSQTARGYELQTLFIAFLIYLLVIREKSEQKKLLLVAAFSLTGIASILTLSTSIIFLFPIIVLHFLYLAISYLKIEKSFLKAVKKILVRENIILGYLLIGGFSLAWFTFNYQQYKQGQGHGISIESSKQLFVFGYGTLVYLVPLPILIMSAILLFSKKYIRFSLAFFFILIFSLGSSLIFKAGPPRVYLPLIPIICLASSYGFYILTVSLKNKTSLALKAVFVLVSCSYLLLQVPDEHKKWFAIDWQRIYNSLAQNLPYNYYICLPATSGYPASYQNNFGMIENAKRTPHEKGFIVVLQEGINIDLKEAIITGIEPISYNTGTMLFSLKSPRMIEYSNLNCSAILFSIIPISQTEILSNNIVVSIFPYLYLRYDMQQNAPIVINGWLSTKSRPCLMFLRENIMSKSEMLKVEEQNEGHILFFSIKEASEQEYTEFENLLSNGTL